MKGFSDICIALAIMHGLGCQEAATALVNMPNGAHSGARIELFTIQVSIREPSLPVAFV